MVVLIGVLFVVVGAVFAWGVVKPNAFCGVRTVWTMADETVWDRTNRLAGELVMVWGALLLVVGDSTRRTVVQVLLLPAIAVIVVTVVFSAAIHAHRHRRWWPVGRARVERVVPTSLLLDAVLLLVPLIGSFFLRRVMVDLPAVVPVHFTLSGGIAEQGAAAELFKVQWFAVALWSSLAVAMRTVSSTRRNVTVAFFLLRLGALVVVQAFVAASVLMALERLSNAWMLLGPAVAVLITGVAWVMYEAIVARPYAEIGVPTEGARDEDDGGR